MDGLIVGLLSYGIVLPCVVLYLGLRCLVYLYHFTGKMMDETGIMIGIVSKLTALFGIRFDQLERNRWREFPANPEGQPKPDTLIVAFGGGALQLAKIPS